MSVIAPPAGTSRRFVALATGDGRRATEGRAVRSRGPRRPEPAPRGDSAHACGRSVAVGGQGVDGQEGGDDEDGDEEGAGQEGTGQEGTGQEGCDEEDVRPPLTHGPAGRANCVENGVRAVPENNRRERYR